MSYIYEGGGEEEERERAHTFFEKWGIFGAVSAAEEQCRAPAIGFVHALLNKKSLSNFLEALAAMTFNDQIKKLKTFSSLNMASRTNFANKTIKANSNLIVEKERTEQWKASECYTACCGGTLKERGNVWNVMLHQYASLKGYARIESLTVR